MIGAILGLAGVGMGAYGQYQAGQAQNATARYNARLMEQRAVATEQAMEWETTRMHDQARRLKAEQEAGFLKSGARIDAGTPLLVLAEQAGEMEMDVLQQRRNRMIEAQNLRQQGAMMKYQGKQAKKAGTLGAMTTLLGGAGKTYLMGGFGGSTTETA